MGAQIFIGTSVSVASVSSPPRSSIVSIYRRYMASIRGLTIPNASLC